MSEMIKAYEDKYGVKFEDAPPHVKIMWQDAWQAALQSGKPVVPPQWRVVMRGMVEYAECNDPGNPYLDQAKALLSAGKENNNG